MYSCLCSYYLIVYLLVHHRGYKKSHDKWIAPISMMKLTTSNRQIYYDSRDTSCEKQADEVINTNQEHFEDDEDDLEEAAEELLTLSLVAASEQANQHNLSNERGRGRPRKES